MNRLFVLIAVMVLIPLSAMGCRHVGGECDCAHAAAAGAPGAYYNTPGTVPAPAAMPAQPSALPK